MYAETLIRNAYSGDKGAVIGLSFVRFWVAKLTFFELVS